MRPQRYLFSTFFRWLWLLAVLASLATGLAHLPLGWHSSGLAGIAALRPLIYEPTLWHYRANALLLFLLAYSLVVWLAAGRHRYRLTWFGLCRLGLLCLLCISGMVLVLHNLPDMTLYGVSYTVCKLLHLGAALCFLPLIFLRLFFHGKWLRRRVAEAASARAGGMKILPPPQEE